MGAGNPDNGEQFVMADFSHSTEATIAADPKVLFDIVSDSSLHVELAGSGELNKVTTHPPGPVGAAPS